MNAISPSQPTEATARTTRHLRMCAELADLAMNLARAAAARTLTNWAEPENAAAAQPQSPHAPAAESQCDGEMAPHSNPAPPRRTTSHAPHKQTDPAVLFTRLAAVVRDCIALEARLATATSAAPSATTLQLRADPRRAPLREIFRRATENHPDRADLLRSSTARVDEELAADPDQTRHQGHIFVTLCDELGIELDLAHLPDEYLTALAETLPPEDYATSTFDPRATSPP